MTYRFRSLHVAAVLFAIVCIPAVYFIYPAIELAMTFLRDTPTTAAFAVLAPVFGVVLFLVLDMLKPVYRHSYRTHGLSLTAR